MKKNMYLIAFFTGSLLTLTTFSQENLAINAHTRKVSHFKTIANKVRENAGQPEKNLSTSPGNPPLDSTYNWNWDNTLTDWKLNKKVIDFNYDAHENATGNRLQSYTGSTWENSLLFNANYNNYDFPLLLSYKRWNGTSWENDYQTIFTYDANGNQTSDIGQSGDTDNWENVTRNTYTYDANSNLTNEIDQTWNGTQWQNKLQYSISYDANSHPLEETDQKWENGAWKNFMHFSVVYDAAYNVLEEIDQSWNDTAWGNTNRYTLTYDANNNALTELEEDWDNNTWQKTSFYMYAYDANGNETEEITQKWEASGWVNLKKIVFVFKTNNLMSAYTSHAWDDKQNAWVETDRVSYDYSVSNKVTTKTTERKETSWLYVSQSKNEYDPNDALIGQTYKYFDDDGKTVIFGDSTYYYIHDKTSDVAEMNIQQSIYIFPNPSSGLLHIQLDNPSPNARVELYNALGKKILEQRQLTSLLIPEATAGMYYIKVYNGDHLYNEKVIIK